MVNFMGKGVVVMTEDALYKQAMKRIDELVEEVLQICDEVADENHYQREWVLDQFRDKFNKAKRTFG
jgi:hypothetical protein